MLNVIGVAFYVRTYVQKYTALFEWKEVLNSTQNYLFNDRCSCFSLSRVAWLKKLTLIALHLNVREEIKCFYFRVVEAIIYLS